MTTGMILSELVDKPDNRMKFDIDQSQTDEFAWFRSLAKIHDKIGNFSDIRQHNTGEKIMASRSLTSENRKTGGEISKKTKDNSLKSGTPSKYTKLAPDIPQSLRIVELSDDSEEDDLIPYAKPDSDPEDEDEDPTLVERNRPTAPV